METAGFIVCYAYGTIYGSGPTTESAYADMRRAMARAHITLLTDGEDRSEQHGPWMKPQDLTIMPATKALLDMLRDTGGNGSWHQYQGGIACTLQEAFPTIRSW